MSTHISRRTFIATTGALGVAPVLAAAQAQAPAPGQAATQEALGIIIEKDVVFGKGGTTDLRCDIYHPPPGVAKKMALILYHGGGFSNGSRNDVRMKAPSFAALGYVTIGAQYRLAGGAKWPAPLEDIKACIRWTRANAARLGIDPNRIGLAGYSAGGFLSLMAAGTQNLPQFEGTGGHAGVSTSLASVFAYYPALEIEPNADGTPHVLMPAGSDASAHRTLTPTAYVKSMPPTAIFQGVADTTIPLERSSLRLFQLLRDAKVPAELHTYAGVYHEFDMRPEFAEETARTGDFFLERYVLHPRTYPPFAFGGRGAAPPR